MQPSSTLRFIQKQKWHTQAKCSRYLLGPGGRATRHLGPITIYVYYKARPQRHLPLQIMSFIPLMNRTLYTLS